MSLTMDGKIALVTGGGSGIGAAIAHQMVEEGATVIAADSARSERTLGDGELLHLHVDVADAISVDHMICTVLSRYPRIDCLVHSAAIGIEVPFLGTTIETFDRVVAVNLRGAFIVGEAAAQVMLRSGGGCIVNIASVSGMVGNAGRSAYGSSKGGVVVLSRVMAVDLARFSIRVNVVAPGPIETPMVSHMHNDIERQQWIARTPMHRYGRPEEVAAATVFLCSDAASYITGHVLAVDGGFLASGLSETW